MGLGYVGDKEVKTRSLYYAGRKVAELELEMLDCKGVIGTDDQRCAYYDLGQKHMQKMCDIHEELISVYKGSKGERDVCVILCDYLNELSILGGLFPQECVESLIAMVNEEGGVADFVDSISSCMTSEEVARLDHVVSQLNGLNGEATNSDDVAKPQMDSILRKVLMGGGAQSDQKDLDYVFLQGSNNPKVGQVGAGNFLVGSTGFTELLGTLPGSLALTGYSSMYPISRLSGKLFVDSNTLVYDAAVANNANGTAYKINPSGTTLSLGASSTVTASAGTMLATLPPNSWYALRVLDLIGGIYSGVNSITLSRGTLWQAWYDIKTAAGAYQTAYRLSMSSPNTVYFCYGDSIPAPPSDAAVAYYSTRDCVTSAGLAISEIQTGKSCYINYSVQTQILQVMCGTTIHDMSFSTSGVNPMYQYANELITQAGLLGFTIDMEQITDKSVRFYRTGYGAVVIEKRSFKAFLNGSNGEHTGLDDMPPKKQKKGSMPKGLAGQIRKMVIDNAGPVLQRGLKQVQKQMVHKKKSKPNPKGKGSIRSTQSLMTASQCSATLLRAMADPFDPMAISVCIPAEPARPTQKVRATTRLTVTIGSSGIGWIALAPCIANDSPSIFYTTPGYTGSTLVPYSNAATPVLTTGVTAANLATLPYSTSQLWNNTADMSYSSQVLGGYCCVWGVKVIATSSEMNLGGTTTCYTAPDRLNLYGANLANIQAYVDADTMISDRKPCQLQIHAAEPQEYSYDPRERAGYNNLASIGGEIAVLYPLSGNTNMCVSNVNTVLGALTACIMFQGTSGNSFYVELVAHNEYYGTAAATMSTPKVDDPTGLARVLSVVDRATGIKQAKKVPWKQAIQVGLKEVAKELAPVALSAVASML